MNGVNGNAELGPTGQPVTPPQPNSLMLNNTLDTSPFTDVHVGHRDTDADSIPDILDTFDVLAGNNGGSDPVDRDIPVRGFSDRFDAAELEHAERGVFDVWK